MDRNLILILDWLAYPWVKQLGHKHHKKPSWYYNHVLTTTCGTQMYDDREEEFIGWSQGTYFFCGTVFWRFHNLSEWSSEAVMRADSVGWKYIDLMLSKWLRKTKRTDTLKLTLIWSTMWQIKQNIYHANIPSQCELWAPCFSKLFLCAYLWYQHQVSYWRWVQFYWERHPPHYVALQWKRRPENTTG